MAKIELTCPTCDQHLELDGGFAGGVCRCSECGTLMTVPSTNDEPIERLRRPDSPHLPPRPESPVGTQAMAQPGAEIGEADSEPKATDSPSAVDSVNAAATQPASTGRTTSAAATAASAPAQPEADEYQHQALQAPDEQDEDRTLTTESGRIIHIDRGVSIPIAKRKRPMVRAVTATVVIVVLALLIGLVGYALFIAVAGDPVEDPERVALDHFGYDPNVNVYELDVPNVLGLSLQPPTAVVVDASGASRGWLTLVQDAIHRGISSHQSSTQLGLIYAVEPDPLVFDEGPLALSEIDAEQLYAFQESITAAGVAPLLPALEEALAWVPQQVVLVTGKDLDSEAMERIKDALTGYGAVTLDLVLVDVRNPNAPALVEEFDGRLVQLSQGQLLRWYRDADSAYSPDDTSAEPALAP